MQNIKSIINTSFYPEELTFEVSTIGHDVDMILALISRLRVWGAGILNGIMVM